MEEKKLTDDEIVKAYEHCDDYIGCEPCILANQDCRLTVIDLIHRLQSKVAELREVNAGLALANLYDLPPNEDCLTDNEFEVARKTIAEQKAEIERLNKCVMSEEQVRKCCADIIQETIQQTVKDTAEKVINDLRNVFIEQSAYGCDANQHVGYYDYEVKIRLVIEQIEEYAKENYDIDYGVEVE